MGPEDKARERIDRLLEAAGWCVQDYKELNLGVALGVAIREYPLRSGPADYLLFVDRKPASEKPWTEKLWIYDLRTNKHFTLKENPMKYEDLLDFIKCYNLENIHQRSETERFKAYTYEELIKRDKTNLDITWLKDESLEDTENLPDPEILAHEIAENLESALTQFSEIYEDLKA